MNTLCGVFHAIFLFHLVPNNVKMFYSIGFVCGNNIKCNMEIAIFGKKIWRFIKYRLSLQIHKTTILIIQ